jgi:hypothetical protein
MMPLGQLKASPDGFFARRVKGNLQKLLGSGQGLPLLFPKHELDFAYSDEASQNSRTDQSDWSRDSWASSKRLAKGALFPHLPGRVSKDALERQPQLFSGQNKDSGVWLKHHPISTRDLALQLSTAERSCAFCILEIRFASVKSSGDDAGLSRIRKELEDKAGVPFSSARMIVGSSNKRGKNSDLNEWINIFVDQSDWDALVLPTELTAVLPSSSLLVVERHFAISSKVVLIATVWKFQIEMVNGVPGGNSHQRLRFSDAEQGGSNQQHHGFPTPNQSCFESRDGKTWKQCGTST